MVRLGKLLATALTAAGLTVALALPASAAQSPVIDGADLFTPEQETSLTETIVSDFDTYDAVFVVETVTSLDGQDIESAALARANELGVGDASKDNGVFILISRDDREVRFELGSGVAAKVSDAQVQSAIDNLVLPEFKNGDYYAGVVAGMTSVGQEYAGVEAPQEPGPFDGWDWAAIWGVTLWVFGGIVAAAVLFLVFIVVSRTLYSWRVQTQKLLKQRRTSQLEAAMNKFLTSEDLSAPFLAARGDAARKALLYPLFADYLKKDPAFTSGEYSYYEQFLKRYADALLIEIQREEDGDVPRSSYLKAMRGQEANIVEVMALYRAACKQEKIDAIARAKWAETIRKREAALYAARRRKQEREAKARKSAAKDFWKGLSKEERSTLKKAKTKVQKEKALAELNTTSYDTSVLFPVLLAMYASEIGRPESSSSYSSDSSSSYSSGSSYSSSSSSSSSYSSSSSSSFDSSSFSGGSFDGGGGGGSW